MNRKDDDFSPRRRTGQTARSCHFHPAGVRPQRETERRNPMKTGGKSGTGTAAVAIFPARQGDFGY